MRERKKKIEKRDWEKKGGEREREDL